MPKWESKIIKEPKRDDQGFTVEGAGNQGVVAWVPLNDSAKASNLVDKAVQHGAYKPSNPNEKEEMKKKIARAKYVSAGIPKSQWPFNLQ